MTNLYSDILLDLFTLEQLWAGIDCDIYRPAASFVDYSYRLWGAPVEDYVDKMNDAHLAVSRFGTELEAISKYTDRQYSNLRNNINTLEFIKSDIASKKAYLESLRSDFINNSHIFSSLKDTIKEVFISRGVNSATISNDSPFWDHIDLAQPLYLDSSDNPLSLEDASEAIINGIPSGDHTENGSIIVSWSVEDARRVKQEMRLVARVAFSHSNSPILEALKEKGLPFSSNYSSVRR